LWAVKDGSAKNKEIQGIKAMSHFDRITGSGMLRSVIIPFAAAILASCSGYSRSAVQVASSKPTVSYVYGDDEGLLDATTKAEGFCAQYSALPTATGFEKQSDGRHITFVCDQPRPSSPTTAVVSPAPSTLNYPYRDDRGLIDAVNQAQRYCSGFNANPRSYRVTDNADGSRTLSFECERM
jgi:hypothetical protein